MARAAPSAKAREMRAMPSLESVILVYVVLALFGFYLLYMYEPISVHFLFARLFDPFV
jgi:hypothetical protein